MAVKKRKASDLKQFRLKALLYGASGTGKTTSALTLPSERTIVISAEAGVLPLAGSPLEIWEVTNWQELGEAFEEAKADKRDILFIDSLTEAQEMLKKYIVSELRPAVRGQPQRIYATQLTMDDWGEMGRRLQSLIRSFRDLEKHVIFTCLEDIVRDESTGAVLRGPALQGQTRTLAPAFFDFVLRAVVAKDEEGPKFYWQCSGDETIIAKFRTPAGKQPPAVAEPNWSKLFGQVLANGKR